MRYSLRTMLTLVLLAAVVLGAWQVSAGRGVFATLVAVSLCLAWVIGPRRLARMERTFLWTDNLQTTRRSTDPQRDAS